MAQPPFARLGPPDHRPEVAVQGSAGPDRALPGPACRVRVGPGVQGQAVVRRAVAGREFGLQDLVPPVLGLDVRDRRQMLLKADRLYEKIVRQDVIDGHLARLGHEGCILKPSSEPVLQDPQFVGAQASGPLRPLRRRGGIAVLI